MLVVVVVVVLPHRGLVVVVLPQGGLQGLKGSRGKKGKGHHIFSVRSLARNMMVSSLLASNNANTQRALTK